MAEFYLTPEEQAQFQARLTGAAAAVPAAGRAIVGAPQAVGRGIVDFARSRPLDNEFGDRAEEIARNGTLSLAAKANPFVGAGNALGRVGAHALGQQDASELAPEPGRGGPRDLSRKAQGELRRGDFAEQAVPMDTPLADVQAAPTLAGQKPTARGGAGGGLGAGAGLKGAYDDARRAGLTTLEQERDLVRQRGEAEQGRAMGMSAIHEAEAMRQQRLAEEQARIDQEAATKHEAFMARSMELTEELGRMKVDPGRLMRDANAGAQFSIGLGAALGGALAAVNGGPNQSLARLDQMIDRDIRAQEAEIDGKKAQLSARNSIFGQMLQETGDRRIAAQQTRLLMLEAAKTKIQSDSERLGIPEVQKNAELAVNGIQQKIDSARTAMAKEAYETFQRQAAAAAAAQAAAAEKAWQRSMEVAKLGLERDKIEAEKLKSSGESVKETNAQIGVASKAMADDDVVKNRALIQNMARNVREDGSVVGFDFGANAKVGTLKGLSAGLLPDRIANRLVLNDAEKLARQDWEQLGLLFQTKITGTGGSDEQMAKIRAAYEGAGTAAEKRNVINMLKSELARREGLAQSNLTDAQKVEFQRRLGREGLVDMPDSVKVK